MATENDLAGLKIELQKHIEQPLSDDTLKWCHYHIFWPKPRLEDMVAHTEEAERIQVLIVDVTKQLAEVIAYHVRLCIRYKLNNGTDLHLWMTKVRANIDRKTEVLLHQGKFK